MKENQKITHEQLIEVLSQNTLDKLVNNVFCWSCKLTKIVDYEDNIIVNNLYDIVLDGKCDKCWNQVRRYIEIWENDENIKKIKQLSS